MSQKQPLVLVIDDDAHMRHMVQLQMTKSGARVRVANHGQAGLDMANDERPDLIIVDYQMPVLDGYEMCMRLRADAEMANIPVIMLTGRGHKLSDEQLAQTNILHIMAKPFSAKALLAIAESLLEQAAEDAVMASETL